MRKLVILALVVLLCYLIGIPSTIALALGLMGLTLAWCGIATLMVNGLDHGGGVYLTLGLICLSLSYLIVNVIVPG